jgi:hypothetical protein
MGSQTWKAVERRIARFFGVDRNPLSGTWGGQGTSSDSMHPELYIEAKHRARHAAVSLWRDTKQKAKREGKTPVVALAEKNRSGFWILVHSSDLQDVAGAVRNYHDDLACSEGRE